jgi:hypothetical protein
MKPVLILLTVCWLGVAHAQAPASAAPATPATPATPAPAKPVAKTSATPQADAHRQEDIAKHKQMAQAHADAARCLESGKAEAACQDALRAACKGIAIGQYCGMRHGH